MRLTTISVGHPRSHGDLNLGGHRQGRSGRSALDRRFTHLGAELGNLDQLVADHQEETDHIVGASAFPEALDEVFAQPVVIGRDNDLTAQETLQIP
jgi:hypothetical protein